MWSKIYPDIKIVFYLYGDPMMKLLRSSKAFIYNFVRLLLCYLTVFIILRPQNITTNRANHVLESILEYRFPNLFSDDSRSALWVWLSSTGEQKSKS